MSGRPTKLDDETMRTIVDGVRRGNPFKTACALGGVAEATGLEWLARGRGEDPDREQTDLFAEFAEQISRARAQARAEALAVIRQAATGYERVRTKRTVKGAKVGAYGQLEGGEAEVTTETTKVIDWKAAAFLLERTDPDNFARRIIDDRARDDIPDGPTDVDLAGEMDAVTAPSDAVRAVGVRDEVHPGGGGTAVGEDGVVETSAGPSPADPEGVA